MKRVLACLTALGGVFAASCATETVPACRAPMAHEMQAFTAIISHNEASLALAMPPGDLRNAVQDQDPQVRAWLWGARGETRGTVVNVLARPPLCVLDDATAATNSDTVRNVLVYPQTEHDRLAPPPTTPLAEARIPYGTEMRDYLSCRFEQTASGWKLADLCGYRGFQPAPVTG